MSDFEIGNVYYKKEKNTKTYFIAISHRTIMTWKNGKFGQYTTKKDGFVTENDISVAELCEYWNIKMKDFDHQMMKHFQPDEEARERAQKDKQAQELELQLLPLE